MVGIVILNYNNSAQTLACLESLYAHSRPDSFKVCVVDNCSSREDRERLRTECREHVIYSDTNSGYARGNNLGLEWLADNFGPDCLMVLNDDTRFTMDILAPLEHYLAGHPDCGVAFPLVLAPDGSVDRACARRQKTVRDLVLQATCLGKFGVKRHEFLPVEGLLDGSDSYSRDEEGAIHTEVAPGSCMMLRTDVFREVGYLDPGTFLYFEEHILCERLRRAGYTYAALLPDLRITHLGAATTAKQASATIHRHWRDSYLHFLKDYTTVPRWLQRILAFRTSLKF